MLLMISRLLIIFIVIMINKVIRFLVKIYLFLIIFLLKMSQTPDNKVQQH
jgi:hypothetical protein